MWVCSLVFAAISIGTIDSAQIIFNSVHGSILRQAQDELGSPRTGNEGRCVKSKKGTA
jgi:hypothetical protein